jgi:coenzyme Q-binding protein COQ10
VPRHRERKCLPYRAQDMFDLVADVNRYPEFLPWCQGARIITQTEREMTADLIIGFRVFRERFTSRVHLDRPGHIRVSYVRGPLKYLHNDWRFSPKPDGGCIVDFHVDFEFKNRVFESLVGTLFSEATKRMVNAFEERASELYETA